MEEEAAFEPPTLKYDDAFPALPESVTSASPTVNQLGQWNNKMRIGSSVVTQVSSVPLPGWTIRSREYDVADEQIDCKETVLICSKLHLGWGVR
jgi:hypothetical protein